MKKIWLMLLVLMVLPLVYADNTTDGDCHDLDGEEKDYIKLFTINLPSFATSSVDWLDEVFEIRAIICNTPDTDYEIIGIKLNFLFIIAIIIIAIIVLRRVLE